MLNTSLEVALADKIKQRGKMTRNQLRSYGVNLKTVRNPYGFDVSSVDRKLRKVAESGKVDPLCKDGTIAVGNQYITHYQYNF